MNLRRYDTLRSVLRYWKDTQRAIIALANNELLHAEFMQPEKKNSVLFVCFQSLKRYKCCYIITRLDVLIVVVLHALLFTKYLILSLIGCGTHNNYHAVLLNAYMFHVTLFIFFQWG